MMYASEFRASSIRAIIIIITQMHHNYTTHPTAVDRRLHTHKNPTDPKNFRSNRDRHMPSSASPYLLGYELITGFSLWAKRTLAYNADLSQKHTEYGHDVVKFAYTLIYQYKYRTVISDFAFALFC